MKTLTTVFALLVATPALAEPGTTSTSVTVLERVVQAPISVVADDSDPGLISPLIKGQQAPFPGVLFSPRAAATVGADAAIQKDKIRIEVEAAVRGAEAKKDFAYNELNAACTADRAKASATLEANIKRIELLEKELQEARKSAPNRGVWFAIGAAAGVVVTGLVAVTVVELTR